MYIDAELNSSDSLHSDVISTTHSELAVDLTRVPLDDGFTVHLAHGLHAARHGMHHARVHLTRLRRQARARREALVRDLSERGQDVMSVARALVARRREDEQLLLRWRRQLRRNRAMDSDVREGARRGASD